MPRNLKYLDKDVMWTDALATNNTFFSYDVVKYNNLYYVVCYVGTSRDCVEGPWKDSEEAVMFILMDKDEKDKFSKSDV